MCGIVGIVGHKVKDSTIDAMVQAQKHRGPDFTGRHIYVHKPENFTAALGHNRLSILDLSEAGNQPMVDTSGRYTIIFNGEVYNYLEIRPQLEQDFSFRSTNDTEVVLNAYIKWGEACLDKFVGMFAFAIWDDKEKTLFAARDRFGVKPFNYGWNTDGNFCFASEIKSLHKVGVPKKANDAIWAAYLGLGRYDYNEDTFWDGIKKLQGGHCLTYKDGKLSIRKWYDLYQHVGNGFDTRSMDEVIEEYFELLKENIALRFRADVPVGFNISGGLDSSALISLVDKVQGAESNINAFTFYTGDARYDELPWVEELVAKTHHPLIKCLLTASQVPDLAESVQWHSDEPFGGMPTLAYARVFEEARSRGVIVLLDGQGMDEQWAGYDYYRKASTNLSTPAIQGTLESPVKSECYDSEFLGKIEPWNAPELFPDQLRNLQYRDTFYTKIPRALRFNDRISMRSSTELREPFLDHRLFELAFKQPADYKIHGDTGKWLLRTLLKKHLPGNIVEAPKRPLQTPQREWLREDLKDWTESHLEQAIQGPAGNWLKASEIRKTWQNFQEGKSDNSFYIWQWISMSLMFGK